MTYLRLSIWESRSSQDDFADELREEFQVLNYKIEDFKPLLESESGARLRGAFNNAKSVASLASNNRYFDIPQSVSSIFTGRESLLQDLTTMMLDPESSKANSVRIQKRFVIYGLGGSGKTQFCCKFAQDNRQRFWGVFWIDGSSEERVNQTFSRIAKHAGMEPNDRAAKSWLASSEKPWLLIIDNADSGQIELDRYFPGGERGHILITTRNPLHKIHGTVGNRCFDFSHWDPRAATSLLLRAANEPLPWTDAVEEVASHITKALGYLPLALIVAGRTIMTGLCTLRDYLRFYESSWKRVRHRARRLSQEGSTSNDIGPHTGIYASCDVMHMTLQNENRQATRDAMELLNVFSFLHRENITVDFLVQGAINPRQEKREQQRQQAQERNRKTWAITLQELGFAAHAFLSGDGARPVLPDCLRLPDSDLHDFDVWRLREALAELSQRSLIMFHADKDSYSLHPIVHTWVQERREMSTGDQAIWSQAAATIISQSILLPPLANKTSDEDFRKDILPHLVFARRCEAEIAEQYAKNQAERISLRPIPQGIMRRNKALSMAKYSLIYMQCGLWKEAEELQIAVRDFLLAKLGPEHPSTIRIQLALAGTYWQQGRGAEAADLQASALKNSTKSLGKDHHSTFNIMDSLAVSRWQQGRYKEALALGEAATDGLARSAGLDHEDTLRAKNHLGCVHFKYWRFEKARQLHHTAVRGLKTALGPDHLDTLDAMENLAMTYFELGGSLTNSARDLETEVYERRRLKLGKEHPHTLLAMLNLARVKAKLGELKEAEEDIRRGLLIAYRNLGSEHMGVLHARTYLGEIMMLSGRLDEANEELSDVIERQKNLPIAVKGTHPNKLMTMYILAECLRQHGRWDEGIGLLEKAMQELRDIDGNEHPFLRKLDARRRVLIGESSGEDGGMQGDIGVITNQINGLGLTRRIPAATTW